MSGHPRPHRGPGLPRSHRPLLSPGQLDREGQSLKPTKDKSVLTPGSQLSSLMRFRTSEVFNAAGVCLSSMDP